MPTSEGHRRRLVRELAKSGSIKTRPVRDAFLAVPREAFVPEVAARGLAAVYKPADALVTKTDSRGMAISSSSAPNIMASLQRVDPMLAGWQWDDRFNPRYQLRALAVGDRDCLPYALGATGEDKAAMALACYNGGPGSKKKKSGLVGDRIVCRATPNCDANRWWGHVEHTSTKAKVPAPGYKTSFFHINRDYPRRILRERIRKYRAYDWNSTPWSVG